MTLAMGTVVFLGSMGALEHTTGRVRCTLAWTATAAGFMVAALLAIGPVV